MKERDLMNHKEKRRILFICLGNICRSVAAEHVFRHLLETLAPTGVDFEVDSAGLIDFHTGELADERMRRAARRRGYELTHRSRPVTTDDLRRFDKIVYMDADNLRRLQAIWPDDANREKLVALASYVRRQPAASIPDPYYGGLAGFEYVLDLLEEACANLLAELQAEVA